MCLMARKYGGAEMHEHLVRMERQFAEVEAQHSQLQCHLPDRESLARATNIYLERSRAPSKVSSSDIRSELYARTTDSSTIIAAMETESAETPAFTPGTSMHKPYNVYSVGGAVGLSIDSQTSAEVLGTRNRAIIAASEVDFSSIPQGEGLSDEECIIVMNPTDYDLLTSSDGSDTQVEDSSAPFSSYPHSNRESRFLNSVSTVKCNFRRVHQSQMPAAEDIEEGYLTSSCSEDIKPFPVHIYRVDLSANASEDSYGLLMPAFEIQAEEPDEYSLRESEPWPATHGLEPITEEAESLSATDLKRSVDAANVSYGKFCTLPELPFLIQAAKISASDCPMLANSDPTPTNSIQCKSHTPERKIHLPGAESSSKKYRMETIEGTGEFSTESSNSLDASFDNAESFDDAIHLRRNKVKKEDSPILVDITCLPPPRASFVAAYSTARESRGESVASEHADMVKESLGLSVGLPPPRSSYAARGTGDSPGISSPSEATETSYSADFHSVTTLQRESEGEAWESGQNPEFVMTGYDMQMKLEQTTGAKDGCAQSGTEKVLRESSEEDVVLYASPERSQDALSRRSRAHYKPHCRYTSRDRSTRSTATGHSGTGSSTEAAVALHKNEPQQPEGSVSQNHHVRQLSYPETERGLLGADLEQTSNEISCYQGPQMLDAIAIGLPGISVGSGVSQQNAGNTTENPEPCSSCEPNELLGRVRHINKTTVEEQRVSTGELSYSASSFKNAFSRFMSRVQSEQNRYVKGGDGRGLGKRAEGDYAGDVCLSRAAEEQGRRSFLSGSSQRAVSEDGTYSACMLSTSELQGSEASYALASQAWGEYGGGVVVGRSRCREQPQTDAGQVAYRSLRESRTVSSSGTYDGHMSTEAKILRAQSQPLDQEQQPGRGVSARAPSRTLTDCQTLQAVRWECNIDGGYEVPSAQGVESHIRLGMAGVLHSPHERDLEAGDNYQATPAQPVKSHASEHRGAVKQSRFLHLAEENRPLEPLVVMAVNNPVYDSASGGGSSVAQPMELNFASDYSNHGLSYGERETEASAVSTSAQHDDVERAQSRQRRLLQLKQRRQPHNQHSSSSMCTSQAPESRRGSGAGEQQTLEMPEARGISNPQHPSDSGSEIVSGISKKQTDEVAMIMGYKVTQQPIMQDGGAQFHVSSCQKETDLSNVSSNELTLEHRPQTRESRLQGHADHNEARLSHPLLACGSLSLGHGLSGTPSCIQASGPQSVWGQELDQRDEPNLGSPENTGCFSGKTSLALGPALDEAGSSKLIPIGGHHSIGAYDAFLLQNKAEPTRGTNGSGNTVGWTGVQPSSSKSGIGVAEVNRNSSREAYQQAQVSRISEAGDEDTPAYSHQRIKQPPYSYLHSEAEHPQHKAESLASRGLHQLYNVKPNQTGPTDRASGHNGGQQSQSAICSGSEHALGNQAALELPCSSQSNQPGHAEGVRGWSSRQRTQSAMRSGSEHAPDNQVDARQPYSQPSDQTEGGRGRNGRQRAQSAMRAGPERSKREIRERVVQRAISAISKRPERQVQTESGTDAEHGLSALQRLKMKNLQRHFGSAPRTSTSTSQDVKNPGALPAGDYPPTPPSGTKASPPQPPKPFLRRRSRRVPPARVDWSHVQPRTQSHHAQNMFGSPPASPPPQPFPASRHHTEVENPWPLREVQKGPASIGGPNKVKPNSKVTGASTPGWRPGGKAKPVRGGEHEDTAPQSDRNKAMNLDYEVQRPTSTFRPSGNYHLSPPGYEGPSPVGKRRAAPSGGASTMSQPLQDLLSHVNKLLSEFDTAAPY